MRAFFVGIVVVFAGCGDSIGPIVFAASVTGITGDDQSAPTGSAFAFPLRLVTLDAEGLPVQGVPVRWRVSPAGGATFLPSTSRSDGNGTASTSLIAGASIGDFTIDAVVPGLDTSISFRVHVLDPCRYLAPYAFGQTVAGVLTSLDCNLFGQGLYYDFYALDVPAGEQSVRISMASTTFDTWLDLWRLDGDTFGPYTGYDDDVVLGQVQNSQLDIILPGTGGSYIMGANSFSAFTTGAYTLAVTSRPAVFNGCRQVFIVPGVRVSDSLTVGDCADTSATPRRYDVARIVAAQGSVLTMWQRSSVINPAMSLYEIDCFNYGRSFVTSSDDSAATTTDAFISYTVPADGCYDVLLSSSAPNVTGPYTFEIAASSAPSPRGAGPLDRARQWWRTAGVPARRVKL